MASIRRTLSPVPRPGYLMNGESCQVASPLSKSSSNSQSYSLHGSLFFSSLGSMDHVLGLLSQRSSRPFERTRLKGQIWRRAFLHFTMCFLVGAFLGLTSILPMNMSLNMISEEQVLDFEPPQLPAENEIHNENISSKQEKANVRYNNSLGEVSDVVFNKLLIIVTPTHYLSHYLRRLAHTLRLVTHPVLWIVVEMDTQSVEIAELLRNTGVMYRHLVCISKNSTRVMDKGVLLRNVAISHIETHQLDGIVYFADEDKVYSTEIFEEMRKISRVGTWAVAKLEVSKGKIFLEGPVCNSSRVMGWHIDGIRKRFRRRFHADMSGFAFNSTMIWDSKRWHRPTIEPIRQLETVKEDTQASAFLEQVVEDERQMECFPLAASVIMVWYYETDSHSYHRNWLTSNSLDTIIPL